jgi:hypothetical protein
MNKAGCPGGNCQGICSAGTQECIKKTTGGQVWSECKGAVAPKPEICNGKDDDCDGNVDELAPSFFSSGFCKVSSETGPCELGKQTCLQGQLVCVTLYNKQAETCNAKDDDCNGVIDDIQTGQSCKVPNLKGPCQQGTKICKRGIEFCAQATRPTTEKCGNGKDDNCDGNVDEPGCTP